MHTVHSTWFLDGSTVVTITYLLILIAVAIDLAQKIFPVGQSNYRIVRIIEMIDNCDINC